MRPPGIWCVIRHCARKRRINVCGAGHCIDGAFDCSRSSDCKAKALAIYAAPLTDQRLLICGRRRSKTCFGNFTCTLGETIALIDNIASPKVRMLADDTVEVDMDTTSRAAVSGNLRSQIEVCDA